MNDKKNYVFLFHLNLLYLMLFPKSTRQNLTILLKFYLFYASMFSQSDMYLEIEFSSILAYKNDPRFHFFFKSSMTYVGGTVYRTFFNSKNFITPAPCVRFFKKIFHFTDSHVKIFRIVKFI